MYYSAIEIASINNGEGIRCVLWESGCTHHCKNCQNKQTWDKKYGNKFGKKELNFILNYLSNNLVDGITFSGGDSLAPFNIKDTLEIVKTIRDKLFRLRNSLILCPNNLLKTAIFSLFLLRIHYMYEIKYILL